MSPQGFETCRTDGGKIRTMKLKGGRYMHVCYDAQGKSHAGEVKTGKAKEQK
jgi:hypothetical protein